MRIQCLGKREIRLFCRVLYQIGQLFSLKNFLNLIYRFLRFVFLALTVLTNEKEL